MAKREVPARWKGTLAEPYWMNEKKCCALIKEAGSLKVAAAIIRVGVGTLRYWAEDLEYRVTKRKYSIKYKRERGATDPEWVEHLRKCKREWRQKPEVKEAERIYQREYRSERRLNDPEWVERKRAYAKENQQKYRSNPEYVERRRQRHRELYLNDPEYRAKADLKSRRRKCRNRIAAKKLKLQQLNEELIKCVESLT